MELVPFETCITLRSTPSLPRSRSSNQLNAPLLTAVSAIFLVGSLFGFSYIHLSRDSAIQGQKDELSWCYPNAPPFNTSTSPPILSTTPTPHNFTHSARGWSSWGIQADPGTSPSFQTFSQEFVLSQCLTLTEPDFVSAGYDLCALDSGWSDPESTDEYGRILPKAPEFNLSSLGEILHENGLKMGVYTLPGFPCSGLDRAIKGTNVTLRDVWNGNILGFGFCDFDFSSDGESLAVQGYFDSVVELWAEWGVDMIKLDYMTPGSPKNNGHLMKNNSGVAVAFHKAILNSGRQIRLDLSWKLCRASPYIEIWEETAESMRLDQDLDSYEGKQFTSWGRVQGTVENYRQFVTLQAARNKPMTIHPDLDNLFVGNPETVTGLSDGQRATLMALWIGASANLLLGSDLTALDALGRRLITSPESTAVTEFCSNYPIVPRNPGTGGWGARQLQAWISGPSHGEHKWEVGTAVVLLVNLGRDLGRAGFKTQWTGVQKVQITVSELGLDVWGNCWVVSDVWNSVPGSDISTVRKGDSLEAWLDEGESSMWWLRPC